MAAANFSRDVLEMFYGPIEENQGLPTPISPSIRGGFEIVRNNFNEWLRVWKMRVKRDNKGLFFFQKTKNSFINVCTHEVDTMKSVKIQFSLLVRFYMIRDEKLQQMDHYFNRMRPVILNEHNMDILTPSLNQFIDEVKGEIEAWSEALLKDYQLYCLTKARILTASISANVAFTAIQRGICSKGTNQSAKDC